MPLPRRSYGRPGTAVIPDGWAASHAPVAAGTMTATVSLRLPGTTSHWDEELGRTVTDVLAPYAAKVRARIQAHFSVGAATSALADAADDPVRVAGYLVTVPLDSVGDEQLTVGTLVAVTACDDKQLVGRDLRVSDIVRGSVRFERDLLCTVND